MVVRAYSLYYIRNNNYITRIDKREVPWSGNFLMGRAKSAQFLKL